MIDTGADIPEDDHIGLQDDKSSDAGFRTVRSAVPPGPKIRLDAFLAAASGESRSHVKKLVEQGLCLVDGKQCSTADFRLRSGQKTELSIPLPSASPVPEEGPLDILYSDEDIAVVNKQAGLTMHPCPSCPQGTLVNRLMARFPQLTRQEGARPGIVHRLDKDTSGLVIIALSEKARLRLTQSFASREVHKTYLAVTRGIPASEGMCDLPVGRHPTIKTRMAVVPESKGGRNALTRWKVLDTLAGGRAALLAVRIFTGRTHQIRVHLAHEGHPLWGDGVYGPNDPDDPARRQMLHAWKLEFCHPANGRTMQFTCPPPEDFSQTMTALDQGMEKIILTGMPGCGKSAVLKKLAERGLPIWSADDAVAAQYERGADGWRLMRMRWGDAFLDDSGAVDRTRLASMLCEKPEMRRELESLIHPLVRGSMEHFFMQAEQQGKTAAVAEVPLWFESGWPKPERSSIAVISCPEAIRHSRLCETRGWSEEKIAAVDSWQWKAKDKEASADMLIHNAGTLENLNTETDRFLMELKARRSRMLASRISHWKKLWSI
ncbi:MAG: dephospho-CoA kinase [Mailhella sp.]|nr:dephospho-CoA kinase [Mailhella sp.]